MTKLVTFLGCGILLTIGVALPACAQADFRPGYIVRPAGDTLRGELDYRDARFSSQHCRFRPGATAEITAYEPGGLRAYGLTATGQTYRVITLPGRPGPEPDSKLSPVSGPAPTCFLEVLVDGPATLYYRRSAEQDDFFYLRSPTFPLAELAHEVKEVQLNGSLYRQEQNGFRLQLNQALGGCPKVLVELPRLLFREAALRRVVAAYNGCVQPGSSPGPTASSQEAYLVSAVVGGQANRLIWADDYFYGYQTARRLSPTLGVEVELRNARVSRRVNLVAGMLYSLQQFSASTHANNYGIAYTVTTRFNYHLVKIPVLMRYSSPTGPVRLLAEAGAVFIYGFTRAGSTQAVASSSGAVARSTGNYGDNGFGAAVLGSVGVSTTLVGQRSLAVRLRLENDLSEFLSQNSGSRTYSLLVSHQLFKQK